MGQWVIQVSYADHDLVSKLILIMEHNNYYVCDSILETNLIITNTKTYFCAYIEITLMQYPVTCHRNFYPTKNVLG